ncbi:tetratricopeptide repeat protein 31 isoform X3 [Erythrolamprus reginae]|uniref:tetratricopeptide repeat protein 31 isoform X3 n=1 Tax=Erythrolamprus reginae TaxID=121349 RepID=UPI00396C6B4E
MAASFSLSLCLPEGGRGFRFREKTIAARAALVRQRDLRRNRAVARRCPPRRGHGAAGGRGGRGGGGGGRQRQDCFDWPFWTLSTFPVQDVNGGELGWYDGFDYDVSWEDSSEEAEEDSEEDDILNGPFATFCGLQRAFPLGLALPQKPQLTAEEAERNAELLVAEEERLKKKAEKKRMRKKRQKDRKRQEKQSMELRAKSEADKPSAGQDEGTVGGGPPGSEGGFSEASPGGRSPSRSVEGEAAEEELDLCSTFVSKARRKLQAKCRLPREESGGKNRRREEEEEEAQKAEKPSEPQLSPVEQSLVLADCANERAKRGLFREAVGLFTEAIELNPQEYRFFGNRSFCHEKLQSHAEALRDAQRALSLRPDWPRGLFRQGKALLGLKQYREAARNFWQLLPLDGFRGDAALQLQKCQAQHSLEGWTDGPHRDWDARPVEMQQLPLPSQGGQPGRQRRSPDSRAQDVAPTRLAPPAAEVPVRDRFAVWVGNLAPTITPQGLRHYFQPFGPVESVRCLPHKACAFVNYSHQGAAKAAYKALQGAEVEGRRLVLQLKHPTHAPAPLPTAGPPSHHGPSSWA